VHSYLSPSIQHDSVDTAILSCCFILSCCCPISTLGLHLNFVVLHNDNKDHSFILFYCFSFFSASAHFESSAGPQQTEVLLFWLSQTFKKNPRCYFLWWWYIMMWDVVILINDRRFPATLSALGVPATLDFCPLELTVVFNACAFSIAQAQVSQAESLLTEGLQRGDIYSGHNGHVFLVVRVFFWCRKPLLYVHSLPVGIIEQDLICISDSLIVLLWI